MTTTTGPTSSDRPAAVSGAGPIAVFDLTVLDTPDPRGLADFYCALLGWRITDDVDDWVTIRGDVAGMAFQLAPDLVPPSWPDPAVPQQFHLDFTVPDLDAAHERVLAIGARPTGQPTGEAAGRFRVYLDPAGHPFCLCTSAG